MTNHNLCLIITADATKILNTQGLYKASFVFNPGVEIMLLEEDVLERQVILSMCSHAELFTSVSTKCVNVSLSLQLG